MREAPAPRGTSSTSRLGVAPVAAGQPGGLRKAVAALPHPQRARRESGALGQLRSRQAGRLRIRSRGNDTACGAFSNNRLRLALRWTTATTKGNGGHESMRVLITGATGTIGLAVVDALRERGDQVVALTRDPERGQRVLGAGVEVHAWPEPDDDGRRRRPRWRAWTGSIHLLGEPVAQRWTRRRQAEDPRLPGARHADARSARWRSAGGDGPAGARLPVGDRLLRPARRRAARRTGPARRRLPRRAWSWRGSARRPPPRRGCAS